MYQQTANPDVIQDLTTGAFIPRGNSLWPADESLIQPLPAPTVADIVARFLPQLQAWMDGIAKQNGYDTALSCISYVGSSVAQWDTDAKAMLAYRDALWTWAYGQQATLAAMTPEALAALTVEEIIAQAPTATASGWVVHGGAP